MNTISSNDILRHPHHFTTHVAGRGKDYIATGNTVWIREATIRISFLRSWGLVVVGQGLPLKDFLHFTVVLGGWLLIDNGLIFGFCGGSGGSASPLQGLVVGLWRVLGSIQLAACTCRYRMGTRSSNQTSDDVPLRLDISHGTPALSYTSLVKDAKKLVSVTF
jgi:hypothetical protein